MKQYHKYVGLDVHKERNEVALADAHTVQSPEAVEKWCSRRCRNDDFAASRRLESVKRERVGSPTASDLPDRFGRKTVKTK